MKRNSNTVLIFGILAVVIILSVVLYSLRDKRYNWHPTFQQNGEEPYDLSLFKKTIAASYVKENYHEIKSLYSDTTFLPAQNGLILFVNPFNQLDSVEFSKLILSAENGNTVFISTHNPRYALKYLISECINTDHRIVNTTMAKSITPSLINKESGTKLFYSVRDEIERVKWGYLDLENCNSPSINVAGNFKAIDKTYTNFIKIAHGDGFFYIHTTPLQFTNLHFKNKGVFEFTSEMMSLMSHQKMFYLDPEYDTPAERQRAEAPPVYDSILGFIFNNPPIKWAWYIMLTLALLYILNTIRRSQRAIPIFQLPENEIANYLDVVSRLYQKEGKHKHIIGIQEKLLLQHLRNKYRLNFTNADDAFYKDAAVRLQMESGYLKQFFQSLNRAKNNSTLSDEDFRKTIRNLNEFYQKCP